MKREKEGQDINLPIDLLVWVVKDGIVKPSVLKTFLFLKLNYPHRIIRSDALYTNIAFDLKVNVKTIKSHFAQLIQVKFISVDKKTNALFIRSKYKLVPRSKQISKYNLKVNIKHLENFNGYLIAGISAYIVKKQLARHKKALINDGALQRLCHLNHLYHIGLPISLSYLAKFLGKSISWVNKYKQKAKDLCWLKVKSNWKDTGIEWQFRKRYLSVNNISLGRAKKYRGKLYIVDSDLLTSTILVIRKKSV